MESKILRALITEPSYIGRIQDKLSSDDFTDPGHAAVYGALLKIHNNGGFESDAYVSTLLTEELQKTEALSEYARIADLFEYQFLSGEEVDVLIERIHRNRISQTGIEFPDHFMTGTAGDFAALYSSYMETPKVFLYFSFLTILGAILSDRLTLSSELRPEPRFFTVLLGESADDRKSTSIKTVVSFFREYFPDSINFCFGIGSAEGLQARFQEVENGKLILIFDELKQLISKCKIEGSVLLPCINTLFENNSYESRTKHTNIQLENIRLSFLGASTVQTYENIWSSQFLDIGFTNRLLLVPGSGERKCPIPLKVPQYEKRLISQQVANILQLVGPGLEMEITKDAMEVYNGWYFSLEGSIHARRIDTYAMRLMSLLAVNEHRTEIDIDIVKLATSIMNWQLLVREQLDPIDATSKIAIMEEKLRRKLRLGPATKRDLMKAVHYERDGIWIFNQALKNLREEIFFDKETRKYELQ